MFKRKAIYLPKDILNLILRFDGRIKFIRGKYLTSFEVEEKYKKVVEYLRYRNNGKNIEITFNEDFAYKVYERNIALSVNRGVQFWINTEIVYFKKLGKEFTTVSFYKTVDKLHLLMNKYKCPEFIQPYLEQFVKWIRRRVSANKSQFFRSWTRILYVV